MARIVTEHGKGREFVLGSTNRSTLFLNRFASFNEHTIRFYKDKIEICKHSQIRSNFTLYNRDDFVSAKKGIAIYWIPFLFALFSIAGAIIIEDGLLTVPVWFLLPLSFGRCIRLKRKKGLPIKLTYSFMNHSEMAEKIIAEFQ